MVELSDELRTKLTALRSSAISFDCKKQQFVDSATGATKRGLTRILTQLVPVPNDTFEMSTETPITKRARKSRNDPLAQPCIAMHSGETMKKCASSCATALQYTKSIVTSNAVLSEMVQRLQEEKNGDKAHGVLVDCQLEIYVRRGRAGLFEQCPSSVDPCVGTLLEHFDKIGWAIVATQVPVYASSMDVATAVDLIATDRKTRKELYLVEIKATRGGGGEFERNNQQYERLRGRLQRTTLRGMPLSYYSRHQLQLFCMNHMVSAEFSFQFDEACVMRVSTGIVRTYKLNRYYEERATRIVRAIALKTGRVKARRTAGVKRKATTTESQVVHARKWKPSSIFASNTSANT